MQVPSWRRAGDSGGTWWWLEADCSHFDPACPAQGCQGSRSCLQPPGGGASGKDPLSHPLVRARVWSQRCLATLGGTLSQPRVGFQLGQGERLKVCPPPPPPGSCFGQGDSTVFLWQEGPPFSPRTALLCPPALSGLSLVAAVGAAVGAAVAWERQSDANRSGDRCDGERWGPQRGRSGQREDGGDSLGGTKAWRGLGNSSAVTPVRPTGAVAVPKHPSRLPGPGGGFPLPTPVKAFCARGFGVGSNPDLWSQR